MTVRKRTESSLVLTHDTGSFKRNAILSFSKKEPIKMPLFHAVVHVDHQSAQIFQLGKEEVIESTIRSHHHETSQHGSKVRTEHEFFGAVCDALADISEILIVGGKTSLADFRHYADKHRTETAKHITDYQDIDRLTDNQIVTTARNYFFQLDRGNINPLKA
jgi:stalled ribosome rescue protein Dom34